MVIITTVMVTKAIGTKVMVMAIATEEITAVATPIEEAGIIIITIILTITVIGTFMILNRSLTVCRRKKTKLRLPKTKEGW
jgi:hypothetical protein